MESRYMIVALHMFNQLSFSLHRALILFLQFHI